MNATTQSLRVVPVLARQRDNSASRKGFWARVIDAIVESRTRRAEEELRRHRGLVSDILARTGGESPFAH